MSAFHRVTTLDLVIDDWSWPFESERREPIDAHFATLRAAKPALWNGRVLLAREPRDPAIHEELARAWLLLGDGDSAIRHYLESMILYLKRVDRNSAARLFTELHDVGLPRNKEDKTARVSTRSSIASVLMELTPEQLFGIGAALEANEQFDLATEAYRVVSMRAPNSQEGETAILKCASISLRKLNRVPEAVALLDLFLERYKDSANRVLAEELRREAESRR